MFYYHKHETHEVIGVRRGGEVVYTACKTEREKHKVLSMLDWLNDVLERAAWLDADLMYTPMAKAA